MRRRLGETGLEVFPLCLGGNVFGWTADEATSTAVLDAYADSGGNFIDTADVYPPPGTSGGVSEKIIGQWLASRGNRDEVVIATKVGRLPGKSDLHAHTIRSAVEDSLRRLRVDHIDLYYAHGDDNPEIPLDETMGAFDELVRSGKVRHAAASNYSPERLSAALAVSEQRGWVKYVALQPEYNLLERAYEQELRQVCAGANLSCIPYFSLAWGFLSGKYRPNGDVIDTPRRETALQYLNHHGIAVLAALDVIAAEHGVSDAAVALAWLAAQPTVLAPIASARNPEQLADLLPMAELKLSAAELEQLDVVSRT